MTAFERAIAEAAKLRARLLGSSASGRATASALIWEVEDKLNLLIERVPATYSELGGGSAVLKRNERAIYVVVVMRHSALFVQNAGPAQNYASFMKKIT